MQNIVVILNQSYDHLGYMTLTLMKTLVKMSMGSL